MNITYLDADTREVIQIVDDPSSTTYDLGTKLQIEEFAASLSALIVKIVPHREETEWTVELKIPLDVRRERTPLSGDGVRFPAKVGIHEHEVIGVYQFKRRHSYIILDDGGGEWEVQSMWFMQKV